MGLDTFAPMLRWQPEMKGNLSRVVLSTTVVGGQTFVPSAHRGGVDDQHRSACRRGSFGHPCLQSIVGKPFSVSTDIIAIESKDKHVPGKFAVQRRFNLMRLNKIPISGSNEDVRIEKDSNRGGASPLALGLDFVCLAIELCHFWLSCLFVKMIIAYNNKAVKKNRETLRSGYGRGLFGQGD